MTLTDEERKAIIEYRIERSETSFKEAEFVSTGNFWNLAANRLYYAAFYMCEALLLKNKITTSSHAGVIRMMSLHFVRTGIISLDEGTLLGRLFRMRQTGDYDDLTDWNEQEIKPMFPTVKKLLEKLHSLICDSDSNQI